MVTSWHFLPHPAELPNSATFGTMSEIAGIGGGHFPVRATLNCSAAFQSLGYLCHHRPAQGRRHHRNSPDLALIHTAPVGHLGTGTMGARSIRVRSGVRQTAQRAPRSSPPSPASATSTSHVLRETRPSNAHLPEPGPQRERSGLKSMSNSRSAMRVARNSAAKWARFDERWRHEPRVSRGSRV